MIEVEFTTQIRIPGKHGFERKFSSEQGWTIETFGERVKLVKDGASFTVQGVPYTLLEKADPPKLVEVPKPAPKLVPAKKGGK